MSVQLLRSSRVFVSTVTTGFTKANTQEILVQDDLSFSQDSNNTDITVNEAGPRPTRGSKRFNDSLNPADWSFSTYLLPYLDANRVLTPDYLLWYGLSQGGPLNLSAGNGVTSTAKSMGVNFKDNAYHELAMIQIYILTDKVWYKINNCQVGQAEVQVDIDDIGRVSWSGNGTLLEKLDTAPFDADAIGMTDALYAQIQASYIKNKLTILNMRNMETGKVYDVPITGGSFTINNNITYLTPDVMSRVDIPIGSFTGTFELTGSLTAYLNDKTAGTAELYKDLLAELKAVNKFEIAIILGGSYAQPRPGVVLVAKQAQVSLPSIETDDVLGTSVEFKAIPTDLDTGDEGYLVMSNAFTTTMINNVIATGNPDNAAKPVTTVTLNKTTLSLAKGATERLTTTIAPADATYPAVKWASSAPNIATVDSMGRVTAIATGSANITATSTDGSNKVGTCAVTVP
ncbi:major tail protein [Serratia phage Slocum]|nr:major tail protein [Serratia phage Slocum]URC22534.1 tail tube protein [Serratia phage vB_SmaM-Kamaji]